jgi:hypothetical protein
MIAINPSSISDLKLLMDSGAPVTLTSHPGNASLYKLSLWCAGIPDALWDVTCCVADRNNWPMHRLCNGSAELLVSESDYERMRATACKDLRFITAYQRTTEGTRLGRIHVRAMETSFPSIISSCSRVLLTERERVQDMFAYLADTCPEQVFPRFITPDGVAIPIAESGLHAGDMAPSFMRVLEELELLLFSDEDIVTKGGACYEGLMGPLSVMLAQYWQTDRIDRYDISGPDMIHYSVRRPYQDALRTMLAHLRRWNPSLIPKHIAGTMLDGTQARVGYVPGHVSEHAMARKLLVLKNNKDLGAEQKRRLTDESQEDEHLWPIKVMQAETPYFSQHDLIQGGDAIQVDDFWHDVPLASMRQMLAQANHALRIR